MKDKMSKRLESIKAAHESVKPVSSRIEDYLEVISELVEMKGYATTLDISRYMNVSAPSVTNMLKRLDDMITNGVQHLIYPGNLIFYDGLIEQRSTYHAHESTRHTMAGTVSECN